MQRCLTTLFAVLCCVVLCNVMCSGSSCPREEASMDYEAPLMPCGCILCSCNTHITPIYTTQPSAEENKKKLKQTKM